MSSADLCRSAAALQAEPTSSSQPASTGTSLDEMHDGNVDTDSSREDVAMETVDDVAIETTTLRRHDSLKSKKRAMLSALAQKRLETVNQTAHNDRLINDYLII